MATGSYSCSSNRAKVGDDAAVRDLLSKYDTHRQVSFDGTHIQVESPSDTFKVDTPSGGEGEQQFLRELVPNLEEPLIISQYINPPREPSRTARWVADPDAGVSYERE